MREPELDPELAICIRTDTNVYRGITLEVARYGTSLEFVIYMRDLSPENLYTLTINFLATPRFGT